MNKSLLIVSCSKKKTETPGLIPAHERYKGVVFGMIRNIKTDNEFPTGDLDILIVSAKLGLLEWDERIENYDQKMDTKQAKILRQGVQDKLNSYLAGKEYNEIFINMGKVYLGTLEGFDWGQYDGKIIKATGSGNGIMNSQMGKWIRGLCNG